MGESTLYVGVDIGKAKHYAGFVSTQLLAKHRRFEKCPAFAFEQSRAGFESLIARMKQYAPLDRCAVVVERTGHYHLLLEQYLQEQDITLYEMQPQEREKRDKTDKRDALSLANHLYNQVEMRIQYAESVKLARFVHPPTETAVFLRSLVKHRDKLSRESVQRRNKLTAVLDQLFPEMTQIIKDPNGVTALNIREKFPTAADVAAATLDELRACRAHYRPTNSNLERMQALARQSIGTRYVNRIKSLTMQQKHLITELRLLVEHIEELDALIEEALAHSREGKILLSLPFGPIQSAIFISSIGNIRNFVDVAHLKSYCGWSPSTVQTGSSLDSVKLTKAGNHLLKRTLCLVAMNAIRLDTEWRDLYDRLIPIKCQFDERKGVYCGKMKVMGRVIGQLLSVAYVLLKKDADILASLAEGAEAPDPVLYDRATHHAHRSGSYRRADSVPLGTPLLTMEKLHNE